jgi:hypothetical protein
LWDDADAMEDLRGVAATVKHDGAGSMINNRPTVTQGLKARGIGKSLVRTGTGSFVGNLVDTLE